MSKQKRISLREALTRPVKTEPLSDALQRAFDEACKALAKESGQ